MSSLQDTNKYKTKWCREVENKGNYKEIGTINAQLTRCNSRLKTLREEKGKVCCINRRPTQKIEESKQLTIFIITLI